MAKRVFISRGLQEKSSFFSKLSRAGFEVIGFSFLQFEPRTFLSPPLTDWVFFYSPRSVLFFIKGLKALGLEPRQYAHFAAMGPGTAAVLEKLGIRVDFTGSGQPAETAKTFLQAASGKSVLFPRAEQSRQSIQRLLINKLDMSDLIVYRNVLRRNVQAPKTDYAVFTSPLNVEAYFAKHEPGPEIRIVAIGNSTAQALSALSISNYRIASQPNEDALAQAVLDWEIE